MENLEQTFDSWAAYLRQKFLDSTHGEIGRLQTLAAVAKEETAREKDAAQRYRQDATDWQTKIKELSKEYTDLRSAFDSLQDEHGQLSLKVGELKKAHADHVAKFQKFVG